MLSRVEVRNYQSLRRADVPLGRFTVITGPSGSGKSALFRAVQMLARNARGTSYVSHGQTSCSVTAGGDGGPTWRGWLVRLTRSSARNGKNEYRKAVEVPTPQPGGYGWAAVTYTKLNSQVPPQVEELLQLSDLNFARQLDPPYLLSLPGTEIARRLGDLTNVSLVLGAAAEANRVRKQASRDLDAARARRDALLAEVQEFAGLKERRRAAVAAGEALAVAQATGRLIERLRALTGRLEAAEHTAAGARAEAARQAPPELERLEELADRCTRLRDLAAGLAAAERDAARFLGEAGLAREEELTAEEVIRATLADAGQCPVCGQAVA